MKSYNLIEDVQALTQIPLNTLMKLIDISTKDIAQIINLSKNNSEDINIINIGIGNLNYQFVDDELIFSFEPTSELTSYIVNNNMPVTEAVSERLKNKVMATYKELM